MAATERAYPQNGIITSLQRGGSDSECIPFAIPRLFCCINLFWGRESNLHDLRQLGIWHNYGIQLKLPHKRRSSDLKNYRRLLIRLFYPRNIPPRFRRGPLRFTAAMHRGKSRNPIETALQCGAVLAQGVILFYCNPSLLPH